MDDNMVKIALIIGVAIVLIITIWKGRGLTFRKNEKGIELSIEQQKLNEADNVSVAEGIDIKDAKIKKIAGVDGATSTAGSVKVANKAKLEGVEIDELVGVKMKQDH
jgi:hypothetical protein